MESNQNNNNQDKIHSYQNTFDKTMQNSTTRKEILHPNNLNYQNTPQLTQFQSELNANDQRNQKQNSQQILSHHDPQMTLQHSFHQMNQLQQQQQYLQNPIDRDQQIILNDRMQQTSPGLQSQNQQFQYMQQQQPYQNSMTGLQFSEPLPNYSHPVQNHSPYYHPSYPQQLSTTSNQNVQFQQQLHYQQQQNMRSEVAYGMPSVYQNTNMVQDDQQQPLLIIEHSQIPLQQPRLVIHQEDVIIVRRRRKFIGLLLFVLAIIILLMLTFKVGL